MLEFGCGRWREFSVRNAVILSSMYRLLTATTPSVVICIMFDAEADSDPLCNIRLEVCWCVPAVGRRWMGVVCKLRRVLGSLINKRITVTFCVMHFFHSDR